MEEINMTEIITPDDEQQQQSLCTTRLPLPYRPGRMLAAAEITIRNIESRNKDQNQLQLILEPKFYEVNNSDVQIKEEKIKIETIIECNNETTGEANINYKEGIIKTELHEPDTEVNVKREIKIEQVDVDEEQVTTNEEAADNTYIVTFKEEDISNENNKAESVNIDIGIEEFASSVKEENIADVPVENTCNYKTVIEQNQVVNKKSKVREVKKGRRKKNSTTQLRIITGDPGSMSQASSTQTNYFHSIELLDSQSLKELFVCDVCDRAYHLKNALIRHISLKHTKLDYNINTFNCPFCSYKACQGVHLRQHINAQHTKNVSFTCPYCSYKTYYKSHLTVHINGKHSKNISFNCSYCSFKTYRKCNLSAHVKSIHTKNISFDCSYCSYKAPCKDNLTVHVNAKHTKITSFACSFCSYTTYNKAARYKHIKRKHSTPANKDCE